MAVAADDFLFDEDHEACEPRRFTVGDLLTYGEHPAPPLAWRQRALCRGCDNAPWSAETDSPELELAKKACAECEVRLPCL